MNLVGMTKIESTMICVVYDAIDEYLTQFCLAFIDIDDKLDQYLNSEKLQFVTVKK